MLSYCEEGSMSRARVLSTEEAKTAIRQFQSIINRGCTDQIANLDYQGRILSDRNVWDGPLAANSPECYVAGDEVCVGFC